VLFRSKEADTAALSPELHALLDRVDARPTPYSSVPDVPVRIVASLGSACRAAAVAARAQGIKARIVRARIEGDAAGIGVRVIASLARQPEGIVQVRGGESTVRLPASPGRGGRNQHLALAAALELERRGLRDVSLPAARQLWATLLERTPEAAPWRADLALRFERLDALIAQQEQAGTTR